MTAQPGAAMRLSIEAIDTPGSYLPIGGLQQVRLQLGAIAPVASNLASDQWRNYLASAGTLTLSVTGSGVFAESDGEAQLFSQVLAQAFSALKIDLPGEASITGNFLVTRYERMATMTSEITASLTIESAGTIVYVSGGMTT